MNPPKKTSKKRKTLIILLALTVIIISLLTPGIWARYSAKPLGNDLDYIGMRSVGIFLVAPQHDNYYYATDLSLDEIKNYFSKAEVISGPSETSYAGSGDHFWGMTFENTDTGEAFGLTYYINSRQVADSYNLDLKGRSNLIVVTDRSNYNTAKDSL